MPVAWPHGPLPRKHIKQQGLGIMSSGWQLRWCRDWPKGARTDVGSGRRREQGQMPELVEEGSKDRCRKWPKKGARTGREVKQRWARTDVGTGSRREQGQMSELAEEGSKDRCRNWLKKGARTDVGTGWRREQGQTGWQTWPGWSRGEQGPMSEPKKRARTGWPADAEVSN